MGQVIGDKSLLFARYKTIGNGGVLAGIGYGYTVSGNPRELANGQTERTRYEATRTSVHGCNGIHAHAIPGNERSWLRIDLTLESRHIFSLTLPGRC